MDARTVTLLAACVTGLMGCGGSDPKPGGAGASGASEGTPRAGGFTCFLGTMTGTWRSKYTQKDGNCGPIADQVDALGDDATPAPPPKPGTTLSNGCKVDAFTVSSDNCRVDFDLTCPNGRGTIRTVGVHKQVSPTQVDTTEQFSAYDPAQGSCTGNYDIVQTKI